MKPRAWLPIIAGLGLGLGLGAHAAAPPPAVPKAPASAPRPPAAACASAPGRAAYVALRAPTRVDLRQMIERCADLGYVEVGGVAEGHDANPAAPGGLWYYQVVIVPPGAASAPASAPRPAPPPVR